MHTNNALKTNDCVGIYFHAESMDNFFFYFRNQKKRTQTEFAQHEIASYQVIVKRIQLMNDKIAYKHADKTDCTVHTQI